MATTPYLLRTITVGERSYRWRQQLSEGWNGLHARSVLRIQIHPAGMLTASITAYAVGTTTPLLQVDARLVRSLVREAMRRGWRPQSGRRITLFDLRHSAMCVEA
jgi:hypothetical protein